MGLKEQPPHSSNSVLDDDRVGASERVNLRGIGRENIFRPSSTEIRWERRELTLVVEVEGRVGD